MIDALVRDTRGASQECRSRCNAPSDSPNMVPLKNFEALVRDATALDAVVKRPRG